MEALLQGTAWIDFEEEIDLTAPLHCLAPLTAALLAGFRLASTEGGQHGNIEHAYVGVKHPRDLKQARKSDLRRIIGLRFQRGRVRLFGTDLRIEEFIRLWQTDAACRQFFERKPNWNASLAKIDAKLRASEPVVKAGYDERRTIMIPIRARERDAALRNRMLRLWEG